MKSKKELPKLLLVISVLGFISLGLLSGPLYAGDKDEQAHLVFVDCDKGQEVEDAIVQFINDKKPLEIIVKGTCGEGPDDSVRIERDNVRLEGDEDVGGVINTSLIVDGARNIEIDDNMTILSLYVSSGEVSIEAEGSVTIEQDVFLVQKSLMTIVTESDDEEVTAGFVTIGGPITIEGHSLLSVESEVAEGEESEGEVALGSLFARLQSSMDLNHASVGDIIVLEFDSHALLGEGLATNSLSGATQVSCDKQSRAWNQTPDDFFFNPVWNMVEESCKTDPPPPPPGP
jgi:hypothetical protein